MDITYHMVPRQYFESHDATKSYLSKEFSRDGFIHCTDGEFMVSGIAYNIFKNLNDELLVLFIDKSKIKAPVRYEDKENLYPHIYGSLNRDSIVKVTKMIRDQKGDWIFPISEATWACLESLVL